MAKTFLVFKALADENRYELIKLLLHHDYCVRALARQTGISQSAVSQHLKILRNADLVRGEKRGYYTHYQVNTEVLDAAADELKHLANTPPVPQECSNHQCPREGKENG